MSNSEQTPAPPLSNDEIKGVREMYDNYRTGRAIGRLVWKVTVAAGATVAGVAAFKEQIISIFSKG